MPSMVSIQFPGSSTVYEITDATARALIASMGVSIGQLSDLVITEKNSLVDAINELARASKVTATKLTGDDYELTISEAE